jgi:hypothetical protein
MDPVLILAGKLFDDVSLCQGEKISFNTNVDVILDCLQKSRYET